MISRIFIIAAGGKLCYFKSFLQKDDVDKDIVSGFLSAFANLAKEIPAGDLKKFSFKNFTFIYEVEPNLDCIFVVVIDPYDIEDEARNKLNILTKEFIKRYGEILLSWNGNVRIFREFNAYVDSHIFLTPKIIITGENGSGKTTILDLFPGETIMDLDIDLNEVIEKRVIVSGFKNVREFVLREVDLAELIHKERKYGSLLKSADVICIVVNSSGKALGGANKLVTKLKALEKKADMYIIANFQDLEDTAYEPEKIEKAFGLQTFPLSAIDPNANKMIFSIMRDILKVSFADSELKLLRGLMRSD